MAAKAVIGIPELLQEIASYIYEPASLSQLCLVNHTFKNALTPQLYRCLRWNESNINFLTDPDRRRHLLKDNKPAHIKIFIITRSGVNALLSAWRIENPRKQLHWRHSDHKYFTGLEVIWTQLNDAIVEICQHAHGLQTFACQDIAIFGDSAASLSSIPSLRSLSIEFHEDNGQILYIDTDATEQYLDRFRHPEEQFVFAGLRKLSLLVLFGDIRAWRNRILKIVLNSPNLEFLALSVSRDAELDEGTWGPGHDLLLDLEIFQWLSREYAKATDRPLQFIESAPPRFKGTNEPNAILGESWENPNGVEGVYIWNEDNGPFLKGLNAFPISDIGPQLWIYSKNQFQGEII
ncbi:hypothetical protein VE03_01811 [Pseudogymnoascus sp. 23342-1-I1]|nr:hypothetical protein VE03_01811 [Pseudogymnoascus sp. 23342-1-I1]